MSSFFEIQCLPFQFDHQTDHQTDLMEAMFLDSFACELRDFIEETSIDFPLSDRRFGELALRLFEIQSRTNPLYRRLIDHSDMKRSVLCWQDIPCIPTVAFKEFALTSLFPKQRIKVFRSSGTTRSMRSLHFHFDASIALYEASLLSCFKLHFDHLEDQIDLHHDHHDHHSDHQIDLQIDHLEDHYDHCDHHFKKHICLHSLTPSARLLPDSSLVHMFDTLARSSLFRDAIFHGKPTSNGRWEIDEDEVIKSIATADTAIFLVGTALDFLKLLEKIAATKQRLPLPFGSYLLETGGYKGRENAMCRDDFYARLRDVFGLDLNSIISEYGMSELSSQAYDQRAGRGSGKLSNRHFRFPPWARARIVSPENGEEVRLGETGLIQVFDLANVWSVLAIQTEDLARKEEDGFVLLGRANSSSSKGCSLMTE